MDKSEAAAKLGVSQRTLDRFVAQGRLIKQRGLRDGRPIVIFNEDEVQKLSEQLLEQPVRETPAKSEEAARRRNDYVGFRMDQIYLSQLQQRGGEVGMSAGEYARHLVVQGLEDDREQRFIGEVRRLREGLADVFFTFLTRHSKVDSVDAQRFIEETILRD